MTRSPQRQARALAILPPPVRAILAPDADLSEWSEFVLNTIEQAWAQRQDCQTLEEIPAHEVLMCQRFLREDAIAALEARAQQEGLDAVSHLRARFEADPWSLSHNQRRELREAFAHCQQDWWTRIDALLGTAPTGAPAIDADFPAFLLELGPFRPLRAALDQAALPHELDPDSREQLQHFVASYRNYLRKSSADLAAERQTLLAAAGRLMPELFEKAGGKSVLGG